MTRVADLRGGGFRQALLPQIPVSGLPVAEHKPVLAATRRNHAAYLPDLGVDFFDVADFPVPPPPLLLFSDSR
jgi:hypothetical protein